MTVSQLIQRLSALDPTMIVTITNAERRLIARDPLSDEVALDFDFEKNEIK